MSRLLTVAAAFVGVILCAVSAVLASGHGSNTASALTACDTNTAAMDARELQMLALVNAARAANGVAPLLPSPTLNRAAAWMSEWMAANRKLDHYDTATGRSRDPFTRMHDCGHPTSGRAENVGVGSDDPQTMLNGFMGSSGHRANILDAGAKTIGLGYSGGYWTMDFSSYDDSADTPDPSLSSSPTPTNTATPTKSATATATPTKTPTPTPTQAPPDRLIVPMLGVE